jgi:pimeloyl-ACP methyl ester carboxylesterase
MTEAAAVPSRKSTNGRFIEQAARLAFSMLEPTASRLGGAWAERLFFTPPPSRLSPRLAALLASADAFRVPFGSSVLATWRWGAGPRVFLVHGWGSRGAHLGAFVEPLLASGFSVVTFDAPAHGSSPGRQTTIPEMARALWAVVEATGPERIAGVVAHSAGSIASAYALRHGLDLGRAVLLASAARPDTYARRFAERLGLGRRIQTSLRARTEKRLGLPWSAMDVAVFAPRLDAPVLVVHDQEDEEVPWQDGAELAVAWPGARLLTTRGLGHHQLLRDAKVVERSVEFLAAGTAAKGVGSEEVLHAIG